MPPGYMIDIPIGQTHHMKRRTKETVRLRLKISFNKIKLIKVIKPIYIFYKQNQFKVYHIIHNSWL